MTTAIAKSNYEIALAGPVGSLDSYIHAVGAIPVLSKEDEQSLARATCVITRTWTPPATW